jgi:glucokinase
MILAGDIGGTKTHLALFAPGRSAREPLADRKVPSGHFGSLEELVRAFLTTVPERPTRAVFGIAGPVVDNRVDTTNLPWHIDAHAISDVLGGARVELINDLESTAWGLTLLGAGDLATLQAGTPATGNRALIAAGTGLGEALVVWDGARWRPTASEGGHTDFAARDPLEDELAQWLRARYGRVSYERILSGNGLADLYRFFTDTGRGAEPPAIADAFAAAADPAAVVTGAAMDGACERARLVLERFVSIYGAEAGNLALKALAVAGVFVGGGIAPRMLPFMQDGGFIRAFGAKGRLSPLLARVPVHVILDDRAALWGAAAVGMMAANGGPPGVQS